MILGIGSINVDHIIDCEHLPAPKESILSKDVTIMLGGKGANQIAAAGRLGADTMFISMVGGLDPNNSIIFEDLKWANVCTDFIGILPDSYSGSAFVCVDESGQNSIIINVAANAAITPSVIDQNKRCFERADVCMTEYAVPLDTCEYSMKLAKANGKLTIVNPAPYMETPDSFYPYIDIITPNEVEAAAFCGFAVEDEKSAAEACSYFHRKGVRNVIITMGSQGAFVSDGKEQLMLPSYPVKAIDTSGAGDSFNGGLAYACSLGYDIFTSARFAGAVASLSVQKKGTTRSMPTLAQVETVYRLPKVHVGKPSPLESTGGLQ